MDSDVFRKQGDVPFVPRLPTPHINCQPGYLAETVLLPGDPLRAKMIAETFLEQPRLVNNVRGVQGYTGLYKDKRISVMGSGMGMPSVGIYAYELYTACGVQNIIRVGSCGALTDAVQLYDLVFAMGACYNSNFMHQYELPGTFAPLASFELLQRAVQLAAARRARYSVGNVLTSDVFYSDAPKQLAWRKMGVIAVEMETAALYSTAARLGKNALTILTVSEAW